jgi:ribonuclease HI
MLHNAQKLVTMSTASKKRKLGEEAQKFYAVKAGKIPGVYMSWTECQDNTTGFKGAVCKSFPAFLLLYNAFVFGQWLIIGLNTDKAFTSKQEAVDFVAGKPGKGTEDRFYGVAVGHKTGVYTSWEEANEQIKDVKGPKYKRFDTRAEAEEFVRNKGIMPKKAEATRAAKKAGKGTADVTDEPTAKKTKTSRATRGKQPIQVYTDGACPGNGRKGAIAGVGVFFGVDDKR